MRVNLNWLKEWVSIDVDANEVSEQLTTAGLEVDSVENAAGAFQDVVIAEIERLEKHPDAAKLSVCEVFDGAERLRVVCGAPNATPGIRVPFARVGAKLPGGARIKAAKLRGVVSNGMLCSGKELGLSDDASGLMILDNDAPVGRDLSDYLDLDDSIFDIDLTPNRGDCFSVIGIARELAAANEKTLNGPRLTAVEPVTQARFPVVLESPEDCPRFASRVIEGVSNGVRSPVWMRERLRRAGLRSISPVVDVTNYVMLELGQPLHAYDRAKLAGSIVVRRAKAGEQIELLDNRTVDLADDVLVITDESGPIGMAGIMGGEGTGVDAGTRDVVLEAAHFAPHAIAGRARRYNLQTDASTRFERGVDPDAPTRAIERASQLLIDIAGGDCGPTAVVESMANLQPKAPIELSYERVNSVLGTNLYNGVIKQSLSKLGMTLVDSDGGCSVTPPSFRFDINIEEDLIEEVARSVGYDNIPAISGGTWTELGTATEQRVATERASDLLVDRGYREVITYSFISEELDSKISPGRQRIGLANPISSDLAVMRSSLWPGLLDAARRNLSRQSSDFRLFECGPQFRLDNGVVEETRILAGIAVGRRVPEQWDVRDVELDFYDVKADVEAVLSLTNRIEDFEFQADDHPALRPGYSAHVSTNGRSVGWLGALHPRLVHELEFRVPVILFGLKVDEALEASLPQFSAYSRYPNVRRDLAVVVDQAVTADALRHHIMKVLGSLLSEVRVFDVYRGPGIDSTRKSVALGLILQDASRTLTDSDADKAVRSVMQGLAEEFGATIRT